MHSAGKLKPIEIGAIFTNLKVESIGKSSKKGRYWICRCLKCDTVKEVRGDHLRGNRTIGCSAQCTNTTHGQGGKGEARTREYRTWDCVVQRCTNENHPRWADWGGRGITICQKWRDSFEAFFEDMGKCPDDCDSIDRIKNEKGYEPGNCQWATRKQQMRNTRSNRHITIDDVTKTLVEWLEQTGTKRLTFYKRTWSGWSERDALFGKVN